MVVRRRVSRAVCFIFSVAWASTRSGWCSGKVSAGHRRRGFTGCAKFRPEIRAGAQNGLGTSFAAILISPSWRPAMFPAMINAASAKSR
jgi:hypothetical protein